MSQTHADSGAAPIRLLMVEDSESDHDLLLLALKKQGIAAQTCRVETEVQLRSALNEHAWHAVLTDYSLPTLTGEDAILIIRALRPEMPIIMVSGTLGEDRAVAAMRGGADDYLLKDNLGRLRVALENAMAAATTRQRRRRAERALLESRQQLRALSAHLQSTIERERQTIARELHDEIGSGLTALRYDLAWFARHGDEATKQRAANAQDHIAGLLNACQTIIRRLRPPILDSGLLPALEWQLSEFKQRSGLEIAFDTNRSSVEIDDDQALIIYRTLQEALTNISKHAHAKRVSVSFVASAESVSIEVSDDGIGIAAPRERRPHAFGLRGLAERVERAGGVFEASRGLNGGTSVLVSVPAHEPAMADA